MKRAILCLLAFLSFSPLFSHTSKEDIIPSDTKNKIKVLLFETYAGGKNLSYDEFSKIETYRDLMYFCIWNIQDDAHFQFYVECDECSNTHVKVVRTTQIRNEPNTIKSSDLIWKREYSTSKNAEYVRINTGINIEEPILEKIKGNKEFLILDFRGNNGGHSFELEKFFYRLSNNINKPKIIVLQDVDSASCGEVWDFKYAYDNDFFQLIGQYGKGCVNFGKNKWYQVDNCHFLIGSVCRQKDQNFLGEGKGFMPSIWVEKLSDFSLELQNLGVDLTNISIN